MTERPHFTDDGCAGQPHILTVAEGRQVREIARQMLVDAAAGQLDDVVSTGRSVALHYGPEGEWFLSCLLAEYTRRGAAPAQPQLALYVPVGDDQADRLLCALAHRHGHTLDSPTQRAAVLEAVRVPLQTFISHAYRGNWPAARNLWNAVYSDRDNRLHTFAFTVLLVLWAARSTSAAIPAQRSRHQEAAR